MIFVDNSHCYVLHQYGNCSAYLYGASLNSTGLLSHLLMAYIYSTLYSTQREDLY